MNNLTITIFNNNTFFEIISEIKLFSKFKIKHYTNIDLCLNEANKENSLVIFFENLILDNNFLNRKIFDFPTLLITKSVKQKNSLSSKFSEEIVMPFSMFDFESRIISIFAKYEFKKNSLIQLESFTIDKNERKIKKDNLELQLSEKEINFLILFSKNKNPVSKKFVLKNVWNYSLESETHTVETHIHRLRKKILQKFGYKNFIKNNSKGYYI